MTFSDKQERFSQTTRANDYAIFCHSKEFVQNIHGMSGSAVAYDMMIGTFYSTINHIEVEFFVPRRVREYTTGVGTAPPSQRAPWNIPAVLSVRYVMSPYHAFGEREVIGRL